MAMITMAKIMVNTVLITINPLNEDSL